MKYFSFVRYSIRTYCSARQERKRSLSLRNYRKSLCGNRYEIEKAGAAIAQVKKQERRVSSINNNRNPEVRAYRANLALALSNRGVLLAATGDAGRAEQDFSAAIALQTRLTPIIESNLERLDQVNAS
jgi:hypothetical protein